MFSTTVLYVIAMTTFVQATTTSSSTGVSYTCPDIETIEVAYGDSCPTYSRTMMYKNTGTTSSANYADAPTSYHVHNGEYQLVCAYRLAGSDSDAMTCQYYSGSGQSLRMSADQSAECPEPGQTFQMAQRDMDVGEGSYSKRLEPQPSRRAIGERGMGRRAPQPSKRASIEERAYEHSPQYTCPRTSNDDHKYIYNAMIASGTMSRQDTPITYKCKMSISSGVSTTCTYKSDGSLLPGPQEQDSEKQAECPTQLCAAQRSRRRAVRRGIYVEDDVIQSRQVDAAALRDGKRRL